MTESLDTPIPEEGEDRQHRRIKSFVMRAGRMTEGQQRGLDQGTPLYVLPLADAPVDFDQVFGRSAPRTLEIGFGMGHSLLEMAVHTAACLDRGRVAGLRSCARHASQSS